MSFKMRTPELKLVTETMANTMRDIDAGAIELAAAGKKISAGNVLTRAVATELKVQLAAPKLAKIIDGESQRVADQKQQQAIEQAA